MTAAADMVSIDFLKRAGLPHDVAAAWLASGGAVTGDYLRDGEDFSRQWRLGAELIARLPPKPSRSEVQAAAAASILERDRASRVDFLGRHAETVYRRLTGDLAKFVRVET